MSRPPVKLSVPREIGWNKWDPIGLKSLDWSANEYDFYLLSIAGEVQGGKPDQILVEQLMQIEADHMGMGLQPTAQARAEATVAAIRQYVESLS